jgi:hypothetical protein
VNLYRMCGATADKNCREQADNQQNKQQASRPLAD